MALPLKSTGCGAHWHGKAAHAQDSGNDVGRESAALPSPGYRNRCTQFTTHLFTLCSVKGLLSMGAPLLLSRDQH